MERKLPPYSSLFAKVILQAAAAKSSTVKSCDHTYPKTNFGVRIKAGDKEKRPTSSDHDHNCHVIEKVNSENEPLSRTVSPTLKFWLSLSPPNTTTSTTTATTTTTTQTILRGSSSTSTRTTQENQAIIPEPLAVIFPAAPADSEIEWTIKKTLTNTDCCRNQCRLLIPSESVEVHEPLSRTVSPTLKSWLSLSPPNTTTTATTTNTTSATTTTTTTQTILRGSSSTSTGTSTAQENQALIFGTNFPESPRLSAEPLAEVIPAAPADEGIEWTIKKTLTETDCNIKQCRLLILRESAEVHILNYLSADDRARVESKGGLPVVVRDCDRAMEVNNMILQRWKTKCIVLIGNWVRGFAGPRQLAKGMQVGLTWDQLNHRLLFSVLDPNVNTLD